MKIFGLWYSKDNIITFVLSNENKKAVFRGVLQKTKVVSAP